MQNKSPQPWTGHLPHEIALQRSQGLDLGHGNTTTNKEPDSREQGTENYTGLSELLSIILEPVADNMEKVMEVKSTSDMLGHIEDMNDATDKKEKIKNTETNKEDNSKNKKAQVPEPGLSQNDMNKIPPSHGSPAPKGRTPPSDGTEDEEDDDEQKWTNKPDIRHYMKWTKKTTKGTPIKEDKEETTEEEVASR